MYRVIVLMLAAALLSACSTKFNLDEYLPENISPRLQTTASKVSSFADGRFADPAGGGNSLKPTALSGDSRQPQAIVDNLLIAAHRHRRPPEREDRLLAAWYRCFQWAALAQRGVHASRYRTAGIDSRARQCGDVATNGARAAAGNPSDRVFKQRVAGVRCLPADRPPARFEPNRLC
jgi:hypothetical protein